MGMTIKQMQQHIETQIEAKRLLQQKLEQQQGDTMIRGMIEINIQLADDAIALLEENIKIEKEKQHGRTK